MGMAKLTERCATCGTMAHPAELADGRHATISSCLRSTSAAAYERCAKMVECCDGIPPDMRARLARDIREAAREWLKTAKGER